MFGNVRFTSPSAKGRPLPPSPLPPWQLLHLEGYTSAPSPIGPAATSGGAVSERTYMKIQIGISDSAAIAHIGILARRLYAATTGESGFGGGAAAAAAALRA